ncbi:MAG: DUF362 domain-containing protein, partial [Candidatus Adiutrix sp.]
MNRRTFLKSCGALVAASPFLLNNTKIWGSGPPDIAIINGAPGQAVRAAIELLGGIGRFVK